MKKNQSMKRSRTADTARNFFYHYRRNAKKLKHKRMSYGDYRNFILKYHQLIADEIINHKFEYKPPFRLGTFRIAKKKHLFLIDEPTGRLNKRYIMVDWNRTLKLWKEKPELKGKTYNYHTNPETGGYYFKWEWSRRIAQFRNMHYYGFAPIGSNKHKLTKAIKQDTKYDAYEGISRAY